MVEICFLGRDSSRRILRCRKDLISDAMIRTIFRVAARDRCAVEIVNV
jgi:hypothetical protein